MGNRMREEFEEVKQLICAAEVFLKSTLEQLNEVNNTFIVLSEKEPTVFTDAMYVNDEGYFQMKQDYHGPFESIVKLLDERRQFLQMQKQQCITQIRVYQIQLSQGVKNSIPIDTRQKNANSFYVRPGGLSPAVGMGKTKNTATLDRNIPQYEDTSTMNSRKIY